MEHSSPEHSSPEHSKLEAGRGGNLVEEGETWCGQNGWFDVVLKGESWKRTRLWIEIRELVLNSVDRQDKAGR